MGCASSTAAATGGENYTGATENDTRSTGAGSAFTSVSGASHEMGCRARFPKCTRVLGPLHTDPALESLICAGTDSASLQAVDADHAHDHAHAFPPAYVKPAGDGEDDLESVRSGGDRVPEPTRAQWALRLRAEAARAASSGMSADPDQCCGAGQTNNSNDDSDPAASETLLRLVSVWAASVATAAASAHTPSPSSVRTSPSPVELLSAAPAKPVALTVVALAAHTFCANTSSPYT
uniref:Uncharacterized protein n=1 Tax=Neobodo designis TaxID=312471 RepID=A0A7S1L897_NEODS|mmetsp:Transcript_16832/g.52264  ORF Transcript_16832/g.52264 Transcript_16832/m.52264 type:complete len:236 (+) Transcript_16832:124-831(+)